jgi:hypothetical protein
MLRSFINNLTIQVIKYNRMLHKTGFDNFVTVSRRGTQVIICFLPCKPGPASSFSPSAFEPDSLKLTYIVTV